MVFTRSLNRTGGDDGIAALDILDSEDLAQLRELGPRLRGEVLRLTRPGACEGDACTAPCWPRPCAGTVSTCWRWSRSWAATSVPGAACWCWPGAACPACRPAT